MISLEMKQKSKICIFQYKGWEPTTVTLGNHKMPFGLEENTSSKYTTFIERSAASEAFAIGRKNGLSIATNGTKWSLKGAIHMEGIDNENGDGLDENYGFVRGQPLHQSQKKLMFFT